MFYLDNIKKNISLASHTTFKIGGKARYFFNAKSADDLMQIVRWAQKNKMPIFILGGGSNVLISDKGFDGLVIKVKSQKLIHSTSSGLMLSSVETLKVKSNKIYADSGVLLSKIVEESIKLELTGLEWAAGIYGTVGGAIRGNAGAFGGSIVDLVKTVEVFNIQNLTTKILNNKDCKFRYRDSIFKHNKNLIILSAELGLEKGDRKKSEKLIKEYLAQRKEKQPIEFSSAGSVFKNPEGQSAGYLIEQCGLKGKKINGAMISTKHANFIVNLGNAKAKDVKKLIDLCKEKVREKFGIELKEEIEYVGDF